MTLPQIRIPRVPEDLKILSRAERLHESLRHAHERLVLDAKTEADLPAWYLLTPAGPIRIRTLGTFDGLMKFTTTEGQIVLVPPESVFVTIEEPASDEPRFAIGFPIEPA
jgi:hypothetical protein